jgi:hypothetical protein
MPVRIPVAMMVLVLGLTVGVVGVAVLSVHPGAVGASPAAPDVSRAPAGTRSSALAVLDGWDQRRARAWATADETALGALYTRDSTAGAGDVAVLDRYRRRGLAVRWMRMQVLDARVLTRRPAVLVLEVTDRLTEAEAVPIAGGPGRPLPADTATTHRLVLRRVGGQWLMATVSDASRSAAAGRG